MFKNWKFNNAPYKDGFNASSGFAEVNNSKSGYLRNIEVEGKTRYTELTASKNMWDINKISLTNSVKEISIWRNNYLLTPSATDYDHLVTLENSRYYIGKPNNSFTKPPITLMPDTLYTITLVTSSNTLNQNLNFSTSATSVWSNIDENGQAASNPNILAGQNTTITFKRRTKADWSEVLYGFWLSHGQTGVEGLTCRVNIMIAEGNESGAYEHFRPARPSSAYPSVLEGTSETNLIVTNKNILGNTLYDSGFRLNEEGNWYRNTSSGITVDGIFYPSIDNIKIWKNKTYYKGQITCSYKYKYGIGGSTLGAAFQIYYTDGQVKIFDSGLVPNEQWGEMIFTTPSDKIVDYIVWTYGAGGVSSTLKDVQIELGNTQTEYVKPKQLKFPFTVKDSLGDSVELNGYTGYSSTAPNNLLYIFDSIDLNTGKLHIRTRTRTFNGTESWSVATSGNTIASKTIFYHIGVGVFVTGGPSPCSSHIPPIFLAWADSDVESTGAAGVQTLRIRVNKNTLKIKDEGDDIEVIDGVIVPNLTTYLNKFKAWLAAESAAGRPFTVILPMEETIKDLDAASIAQLRAKIHTFEDDKVLIYADSPINLNFSAISGGK